MSEDQAHNAASRLANITTMWTLLEAAHHEGASTKEAQTALLQRYGGAVYRYLLAAVRDPHVADDLTQEFALRLIRGGFRHADPNKGRFRDYLKTSLFHLVSEYRRHRGPRIVDQSVHQLADPAAVAPDQEEAEFLSGWRDELLAKAWEALREKNETLFETLKLKSEAPQLSSEQLAEQLSQSRDQAVTPAAIRQQLRRARDVFAAALRDEIAFSLSHPSDEEVDEELRQLDLWRFVERRQ